MRSQIHVKHILDAVQTFESSENYDLNQNKTAKRALRNVGGGKDGCVQRTWYDGGASGLVACTRRESHAQVYAQSSRHEAEAIGLARQDTARGQSEGSGA